MLPTARLPLIAVSGMTFEARIAAGPGVVTVCAGRPDALAAGLAAAIAKGCSGIVSFGIAGGLAEHLRPGACIVARAIVTEQQRFDTHPDWARRLLRMIPGAILADLAGARAAVVTAADKIALGRATGAAAVDMESMHCAEMASAHGLPFAALRVVADAHRRELPPAAQIGLLADGRPDMPAVLRSVLGRPRQIGALIRVAFDTRTARAALVRARRPLGPGFGLVGLADPAAAQAAAAPAE